MLRLSAPRRVLNAPRQLLLALARGMALLLVQLATHRSLAVPYRRLIRRVVLSVQPHAAQIPKVAVGVAGKRAGQPRT